MIDTLGFRISEQVLADDGRSLGSWLHVTPKSYDLAYGRNDPTGVGGRLHHVAYAVDAREYVLRAADIYTDYGVEIEAGPAKHAVQQTFFLYAFEPGGNRIELITDVRLLLAPDWKPITWTQKERERGQAWLTLMPESWFTYATPPVESPRPSHHDRPHPPGGAHDTEEPAGSPGSAGDTVEMLRNSQIGAYVYPVVAGRVHELAPEQRAWREPAVLCSTSRTTWSTCSSRPGRAQADLRHRDQQLRELPGQHAPSSTCRRTPDGHVIGDGILFHSAEDEFVFVGRAPGGELAAVPRRDRRLQRRDRARTTARRRGRWARPVDAQVLALPDPGPERVAGDREAQRRPARAAQVLPHGRDEHRRQQGPHAAPRHGRRAGPRDLGPVRGARRGPRRDRRGRQGVRPRCTCGSRAYPSNTLESGWIPSPLPADLHRRGAARVPRVAAGRRATRRPTRSAGSFVSDNIEDYYLKPCELGYGPFVKFDHDFIGREALEKIDPAAAAQEGHAGVERRGHGEDLRLDVRRPRATATSSSTCRSRTTARRTTTRSSTPTATSSGSRCSPATARTRSTALSLATVDPDDRGRDRGAGRLGRAGRRHAEDRVEPHRQIEVRASSARSLREGRPPRVRRGLANLRV